MKFTKFAIVLIFLLSISAFTMTAFLATIRENEKEKRIELQSIRVKLEEKVKLLEEEKLNYQKQVDTLNTQLEESLASSSKDRASYEQVRAELEERDKLVEARKKEVEELQRAVQLSEERNRELETTLDRMERAFQEAQRQQLERSGDLSAVAGVPKAEPAKVEPKKEESKKEQAKKEEERKKEEKRKKEEAKKKEDKKETVPTPEEVKKSIVPAEPAKTPTSESLQAGRVLLVNRKFNFVIINMGTKQGLKSGDAFMVLEGQNKIARVEVEKLYDDFAAAKITEQIGDNALLQEGNLVTRL